jgi:hypothetical protein
MTDSFGNAHALAIGVGGNLPVTANDAKAVAKIFADPERCAVPESNVKVLTDGDASRDGIVAALGELARRAAPDDVVTVYFSGHGLMVPTEPVRYFLVPHDEKYLDGRTFTELLRSIRARRLLVLLDCCYAAGIHASADFKAEDVKSVPVPFELSELRLRAGSGTAVLSSSRRGEVSLPGNPYSIFTQVLIEGLCGAGASEQDGYVRVADLAMYLSLWVPQLTRERQHPTLDFEAANNYPVAYYAAGSKAARQPPAWFGYVAEALARDRAAICAIPPESLPAPSETAMAPDDAIRVLSGILSANIYDKDECILIVRHSKTPVVWSGNQVTFWDKVLDNAHRASRMTALFAAADEFFGENVEWQEAKQAYLSACEADRRARKRDTDGKAPDVVNATLNERYLRELRDALGSIAAEHFRDPRISDQELRTAGRTLLAVGPIAAVLHTAAEAETRYPRRWELERADRALATHHKEVAVKLSALQKVGSEKAARPLCDGLAQEAAALLTAYAEAIHLVT